MAGRCGDWPAMRAAAGLHAAAGQLLGLFNRRRGLVRGDADAARIEALIAERRAAPARQRFRRADEIRAELEAEGIVLEDGRRHHLAEA
jgi:cysteinyl-tRNA synthetase